MDILITVGIFPPDIGGPASFVPKISQYLIDKGHKIKIICLSDRENLNRKDDFNVVRIDRSLPILIRWIKTVINIYKHGKNCDLIFVNGLGTETTIANRFLKKVIVRKIVGDPVWERAYNNKSTTQSFDEFQKNKHNLSIGIQKKIRNWSINRSDLVITPSRHLYNFVQRIGSTTLGIDSNIEQPRGDYINNGVEIININKKLFGNKKIKVLVVSRLVVQKNIDLVIKAIKHNENKNIHLDIIGDGNELDNLKNLVNNEKLNDRINFVGKVDKDKLSGYLKKADIFIQASDYEGLPHSILEAMNHEISILATQVGGCYELLEDEKRGYIISTPVSELEIAKSIDAIIKNKDESINKTKLAKEYIKIHYNFKSTAKYYEDHLKFETSSYGGYKNQARRRWTNL